mgnify:CR=1 FL=1
MEVHHHPHVPTHVKPWKEYLLEGIMIFIAVSFGYTAENIREHYIETKKAVSSARNLYVDLVADSVEYASSLQRRQWQEDYFDILNKSYQSNQITKDIGLENFESIVSVPTGGLVIASALAIETVKPLIYVRSKPKDYGTSKSVEGKIHDGMKVVMIDDVATTGGSVVNAIKSLRESDIVIEDAYVIVNRMEGAEETLKELGVKMYSLVNIIQITQALHEQKLVSDDILEKVRKQIEK